MRCLRVPGKGSKIRYVPRHPDAAGAIVVDIEAAGHGDNKAAPLFHSVSNNACGAGRPITQDGVYSVPAKVRRRGGMSAASPCTRFAPPSSTRSSIARI